MNRIRMKINRNVEQHYSKDYINSIEMWCSAYCTGGYTISVFNTPKYNIPSEVSVLFDDPEDAAYFKLCPLWVEEICQ